MSETDDLIEALDEAVTDWEDVVADRGRIIRELAEAKAQIAAVLSLHRKWTDAEGDFCLDCVGADAWPCQTARALGVTE